MSIKKTILLIFCVGLLFTSKAFAYDKDFDYSTPLGTDDAGTLDSAIQDTKYGIGERLNNDHFWPIDSTIADNLTYGTHRRVTMHRLYADPTDMLTESGILYTKYDGADVELFYTDDDANVTQIVKDGALLVSGDLNANSLSLSSSLTANSTLQVEGNAVLNGTLSVDDLVYISNDVTITGHLFASEQLGAWDNSTYSFDTAYLAAADGFALATTNDSSTGAGGHGVEGLTDTSNPPTTSRLKSIERPASDPSSCSISMPVKKGHYWKVTKTEGDSSTLNWIPFD